MNQHKPYNVPGPASGRLTIRLAELVILLTVGILGASGVILGAMAYQASIWFLDASFSQTVVKLLSILWTIAVGIGVVYLVIKMVTKIWDL